MAHGPSDKPKLSCGIYSVVIEIEECAETLLETEEMSGNDRFEYKTHGAVIYRLVWICSYRLR